MEVGGRSHPTAERLWRGKGGLSKDKDLKDVHVVADFAIFALQPVLNFIQKCQALVYFRARSVGRFTSMHFSQHFLVTRGWCRETRKKLRDGNVRKTKATYTVSREPGKQTGDLGEAPGEGGSGRRKKGNLVLQIPKSLLRKAASWEKLAAVLQGGDQAILVEASRNSEPKRNHKGSLFCLCLGLAPDHSSAGVLVNGRSSPYWPPCRTSPSGSQKE